MDFIDNVDTRPAPEGKVPYSFPQTPDVLDAGMGRTVDFQHVRRSTACYFKTGIAFLTRIDRGTLFAVDGFCEDTSDGCFSNAPVSGKKKGLWKLSGAKGSGESPNNKLLTDKIGKKLGTPFSGQRQDG